jgi:hypothetical protein
MKHILISNGTNDYRGYTKATTENGYLRAAKRIWPYVGLSRVWIKVWDPIAYAAGQDPIIFEAKTDI